MQQGREVRARRPRIGVAESCCLEQDGALSFVSLVPLLSSCLFEARRSVIQCRACVPGNCSVSFLSRASRDPVVGRYRCASCVAEGEACRGGSGEEMYLRWQGVTLTFLAEKKRRRIIEVKNGWRCRRLCFLFLGAAAAVLSRIIGIFFSVSRTRIKRGGQQGQSRAFRVLAVGGRIEEFEEVLGSGIGFGSGFWVWNLGFGIWDLGFSLSLSLSSEFGL